MHRTLPRLRAEGARPNEDQIFDSEVLHHAGDRSDVAFILRLDENDAD